MNKILPGSIWDSLLRIFLLLQPDLDFPVDSLKFQVEFMNHNV